MITSDIVISTRASQLFALTLIHFIWQGAILAGLLALWLALNRRSSANTRYLCSITAFGAMVLCPLITGTVLGRSNDLDIGAHNLRQAAPTRLERSASVLTDIPPLADNSSGSSTTISCIKATLNRNSRQIVLFWLVGIVFMVLRGVGGWLRLRRIFKPDGLTTGPSERLVSLARKMNVMRVPRICISGCAPSALVFGVVRAVIVIPTSAILGLTSEMLDAILAHELAHVRRHDYLVNLLQCIVETVLFYNPAVWWVCDRIREEREFCCDDMVIATLDDRITYARALEGLEQLRGERVMVAAGSGSLLARVQRILQVGTTNMNMDSYGRSKAQLMAGICAIMLGVGMMTGVRGSSGQTAASPPLITWAENDRSSKAVADGPGVIITLEDSRLKPGAGHEPNEAMIHDTDLQVIVQELRAANAKVIYICDQRVDLDTHIRAWGNNIAVNSFGLGRPFVVRALGDPDTLLKAVESEEGVLKRLRRFDPLMTRVETSEGVQLPSPPANQPKAAYIMEFRMIRCETAADGTVRETVVGSPSASTFAGMPATFSISNTTGEGETLTVNPGPALHQRVQLKATFVKIDSNHVQISASTPTGFTVERSKNTRILGVVSTSDSELKKLIERGKTVRGHGAYTAYYVEVKVE